MANYLDSKADLTFKGIFFDYPNLMISQYSVLLPFLQNQDNMEVEYVSPEIIEESTCFCNIRIKCNFCDDILLEGMKATGNKGNYNDYLSTNVLSSTRNPKAMSVIVSYTNYL